MRRERNKERVEGKDGGKGIEKRVGEKGRGKGGGKEKEKRVGR